MRTRFFGFMGSCDLVLRCCQILLPHKSTVPLLSRHHHLVNGNIPSIMQNHLVLTNKNVLYKTALDVLDTIYFNLRCSLVTGFLYYGQEYDADAVLMM